MPAILAGQARQTHEGATFARHFASHIWLPGLPVTSGCHTYQPGLATRLAAKLAEPVLPR